MTFLAQLSVYGGSAWTFNEQRQEFYYHTFSEDEPDLNLRNDRVVADLDVRLVFISLLIEYYQSITVLSTFEYNLTIRSKIIILVVPVM